jgi:integrase
MVTVRYKKLSSGKFSAYLDIYSNTVEGKGKRNYEFLKIYVGKDYSVPGTRITESDKDNLKIINALRNKRENELNFSDHGYKQPVKINYNLLDYFDQCLAKKFNYKLECLIIHLKRYFPKRDVLIQDVDEDLLDNFQSYLLNQVSRNTTNAYLSVFRQHFNKLVVKGVITASPFSTFKIIEEGDTERTTLTIEEVRTLANFIPKKGNSQIRQAFLFSCFTGLRFSDVKKLVYSEIENDQITFRPAKTTKKIVMVPLTDDAKSILENLSKHPINKKVFWDLPSSQVVNVYLKFWALEAGLKKNLHFHAARHTFATIGLTFGMDIYTVKEILGHSKIEMTQIYAKIVDQKKKFEMLKFPPLIQTDNIINYILSIGYQKKQHPNFPDSFKFVKSISDVLIAVVELFNDGSLQLIGRPIDVEDNEVTYWNESKFVFDTDVINPTLDEFKIIENTFTKNR